MEHQKQKSAVAQLSVISNSTLVLAKLVIGVVIGSVSVISEAIHSGVDLVASIIALVAVKTGGRPADEKHPYGHGKIENISGTVEAVLIFVAAAWIIVEAIKKLIHPQEIEGPGWGVVVMGGSAVINLVVSQLLFKVGKKTDSVALQADGWHLRTDVYTSAGVMLGLAIIWAGETTYQWTGAEILSNLHWIDPVAALVVAMLIIQTAWKLTAQSAGDLMDRTLPIEEETRIREVLSGFGPRIRGFHKMRTRKAGPTRFIEFHIFVDGTVSVKESHALAHEVAAMIGKKLPGSSVIIHVEPCLGDCDHGCAGGCLLSVEERAKVRNGNRAGL